MEPGDIRCETGTGAAGRRTARDTVPFLPEADLILDAASCHRSRQGHATRR